MCVLHIAVYCNDLYKNSRCCRVCKSDACRGEVQAARNILFWLVKNTLSQALIYVSQALVYVSQALGLFSSRQKNVLFLHSRLIIIPGRTGDMSCCTVWEVRRLQGGCNSLCLTFFCRVTYAEIRILCNFVGRRAGLPVCCGRQLQE